MYWYNDTVLQFGLNNLTCLYLTSFIFRTTNLNPHGLSTVINITNIATNIRLPQEYHKIIQPWKKIISLFQTGKTRVPVPRKSLHSHTGWIWSHNQHWLLEKPTQQLHTVEPKATRAVHQLLPGHTAQPTQPKQAWEVGFTISQWLFLCLIFLFDF